MLVEILGWIGSLCVLVAYVLNVNKRLATDTVAYYALNIVGSTLLIVNTAVHHAYPSMVINIVWVIVPVVTIIRYKMVSKSKSG